MISKEIIESYKKLDSACISDALDSLGFAGGLEGIQTRVAGKKIVGPAFTVRYRKLTAQEKKEYQNAGEYIDLVPEGSVIVIDNQGQTNCTSWGNILTEYAVQKAIAGTIVHGSVRDVEKIKKLQYPVFSTGVFMQSGKNRAIKDSHQTEITIGNVRVAPDDLVFADDNGCIVIPQDVVEEVLKRAEAVRANENKILEDIKSGKTLVQARKDNNYKTPWLQI